MSDLQIISSINEIIALTLPEILLRQASRFCAPVLTQRHGGGDRIACGQTTPSGSGLSTSFVFPNGNAAIARFFAERGTFVI